MNAQATRALPIRAAVYASTTRAEQAIRGLRAAGFAVDQLTVICSRDEQRDHFRAYLRQEPAGSAAPAAAAAGGAVGAALAGVVVIGAAAVVASPLVVAIGGASIWAGGIVGGLVGAMMKRGVDRELANYYQQAIQEGKVLVAVDLAGRDHDAERVERILAEAGAEPVALPEG